MFTFIIAAMFGVGNLMTPLGAGAGGSGPPVTSFLADDANANVLTDDAGANQLTPG